MDDGEVTVSVLPVWLDTRFAHDDPSVDLCTLYPDTALLVPLDEALQDSATFVLGATLLADYVKPVGAEGALNEQVSVA